MQLISELNKRFKCLLCVTDIYSKYGKAIEFHNKSMKLWLEKNNIEMYSTHNEGKYVVAERLIRTIKNKIYKYMTLISKNVHIDKLDDIVDKYNKKKHRTIKMKPIDVKDNSSLVKNSQNS